jgi:hypothetical protein
MDDDDDIEIPAWMEYKQDELDEHLGLTRKMPGPTPVFIETNSEESGNWLADMVRSILGTKP